MFSFKRAGFALAIASAVALAGIGTTSAAHHQVIKQVAKDSLTVKITQVGQVWGIVTVSYTSGGKTHMVGTCKVQQCSYKTPHAIKLNFHQKEVSHATWPFKNWKIQTGGKTSTVPKNPQKQPSNPPPPANMSTKLSGGKGTVSAVYVLPGN